VGSAYLAEMKTQLAAGDSAGRDTTKEADLVGPPLRIFRVIS